MNARRHLSHEQAAELLPWLVNDSLAGEERENVLVHARDCVICRRDLDEQQRYRNSVAGAAESMVIPAPDMRNINSRIDGLIDRQNRRRQWMSRLRDMVFSPWRVAFAVQSILVIVLASVLIWPGSEDPAFTTLTQPQELPDGHYVRVVFSPELTASEFSDLLDELSLTVADGPSERGVFTLGYSGTLEEDEYAQLLEDLRKEANVLFAQPVVLGDIR